MSQDVFNPKNNTIECKVDVVVPEPQNTKSGVHEMPVTTTVRFNMWSFAMLGTINLNDKAMAKFSEVENVAVKRNLAAEVVALAVFEAKNLPEFDFFTCHAATKGPCSFL